MELAGTFAKAVIFADNIDRETLQQIINLLEHPAFTEQIRIMPDVHGGKGSVIGFTMPLSDKIIPNVIGVDIGCGISAAKLRTASTFEWNLSDIDATLRRLIPAGFAIHKKQMITHDEIELLFIQANSAAENFVLSYQKKFKQDISFCKPNYNYEWLNDKITETGELKSRYWNSIGTLGGGNHFIELAKDENKNYWLLIHSGSRHFGQNICLYWQHTAICQTYNKLFSKELAFLEKKQAYQYLFDMIFAQQYAHWNRKIMQRILCENFNWNVVQEVESVHNYIDFGDLIIRKGAIRAYHNELLIVPLNMQYGSWIMEGKTNPDWNFSAPHGAGRLFSRTQAKKNISLEHFKNQMKEIYSSSISSYTIDESPDAYKKPDFIKKAIQPTAHILSHLIPVLNFKDTGINE
jgi:RNA-splicing ligase RtcB